MTQDLLTNLFKGYLAAKDKSFCAYINTKKENHEEGQTITTDQIMKWAKNKYEIIKETGKWNAPSNEEQQIIALRTEVKNIKEGKRNKTPKNQNRRTFSEKPNRNWEDKPSWFNGPPLNQEKFKPKTWLERQWYWCGKSTGGKCEKWRQHKPTACGQFTPTNTGNTYRRNRNYNDKDLTNPNHQKRQNNNKKFRFEDISTAGEPDHKKRKLQLQKALSAVASDQNDDSDQT